MFKISCAVCGSLLEVEGGVQESEALQIECSECESIFNVETTIVEDNTGIPNIGDSMLEDTLKGQRVDQVIKNYLG